MPFALTAEICKHTRGPSDRRSAHATRLNGRRLALAALSKPQSGSVDTREHIPLLLAARKLSYFVLGSDWRGRPSGKCWFKGGTHAHTEHRSRGRDNLHERVRTKRKPS